MAKRKQKRKQNQIIKIIFTIIILALALFLAEDFNQTIPTDSNTIQQTELKTAEGEFILTMIDAGQADSLLLIQNETVALIDCGTAETGKDVVKYLQELGVQKIDYLFGTHPHEDHMGGMYNVISNFEIGKIILPKVNSGEVTTNWYLKLMQKIKNDKYELEYAKVGTRYNLGEATMKVIGPISTPEENLNNYSTVLKISFGEMDVIMTGDAETTVEKEILASGEAIDAEILKVGHHGSNTSTSNEFLDAISPQYALISCKMGNKYEHPTTSTMEKLKKRNIQVYRTDENGTVTATITDHDVSFSCEPGDYLSGTELGKKESK